MPSDEVTDSSAEIRWKGVEYLHSDLSHYYVYGIAYRNTASADWQNVLSGTHSDTTQSYTLRGLIHNTEYEVRLASSRQVGSDKEDTDRKTADFTTDCIGKGCSILCASAQVP